MRLATDLSLSSRAALGGGGVPGWVPNPANPPDIAINWAGNQVWRKSTGLSTPALLGITTSRASVKQVVDSNGNWSQVAANVTAMSNLGRSTEEARTNSIRNNTMQGAVAADGVEQSTNGNFALNPINAAQNTVQNGWLWTKNTGTGTVVWDSVSKVTLTGDGTNAVDFGASFPTVAGFTYTVSFDVFQNPGTVLLGTAFAQTQYANVILSATGTGQKLQFTATGSTAWVTFHKSAAFAFQVANVSVQSAGVLPTNWTLAGVPSGVTISITTATINGVDTISVTFTGTNTSGSTAFLGFATDTSTATGAGALYGQTWSVSTLLQTSGANQQTWGVRIVEYNNVGTFLTQSSILSGSQPASLTRVSASYTVVSATAAFVQCHIDAAFLANGATINQTVTIGWPQLENNSINSTVASATVAAGGASGVTGTAVYSVGGGTGTAATLNVTVSGGAITAINSVASAGSYSVFPPSPAALTYVSGTGSGVVGATVNLTPTNLAANAFATSPIKTTAGAATRAADVTTLTGQTFGAAYSMFEQATPQSPNSYGFSQNLLQFDVGTNSQRSILRRNTTAGILAATVGGTGVNMTIPGPFSQNVQLKAAASWAAAAQASVVNGGTVATGSAAALPTTPTQIEFGNNATATEQFNGLAAIDAIWLTQAVPSLQLQSMTT